VTSVDDELYVLLHRETDHVSVYSTNDYRLPVLAGRLKAGIQQRHDVVLAIQMSVRVLVQQTSAYIDLMCTGELPAGGQYQ